MDADWIRAVMLLCVIAENNADSMKKVIRYVELMSEQYGLDADSFRQVYDIWYRTGEVRETYRKNVNSGVRPLYHCGIDGMCRMMNEGIIDEEMFFESLEGISCKILKEKEGYTGFYPALPGCIAFAKDRKKLKEEMQRALKAWIRSDFYLWRELQILEE